MSKKPKSGGILGRALNELQNMKHKDLKRACVVRGMPFEEVVDTSTPGLSNWFQKNYHRSQDLGLLDQFDYWVRLELQKRGYAEGDPMLSPSLGLGYVGEINPETGEAIIKRPKGMKKPPKAKRERDEETGLFKGTKKDLTYQCQKDGMEFREAFSKVLNQFPEAQEKSVRIWFNRARKVAKGKK